MSMTLMIHDVTSYTIEKKEIWSSDRKCPYVIFTIYVDGQLYGDITLFEKPAETINDGHDTNE